MVVTVAPRCHLCLDDLGRSYTYELTRRGEDTYIYLFHEARCVGSVQYRLQSADHMLLLYILIQDQVQEADDLPHRIANGIRGIKPHPVNYRGHQLGTHLLGLLIAIAKQIGIKVITGDILMADFLDNPHLVDWYRRNSFRVQMLNPASQAPLDLAASISLHIP